MHANSTKRRSSLRSYPIHHDGISPRNLPWPLNVRFRDISSKELEDTNCFEPLDLPNAYTSADIPVLSEAEVDCLDFEGVSEALHVSAPENLNSVFRKRKRIASPHLSLSLFRRPENTVRLTKCDPSRKLEVDYDLQGAEYRVLGHGAFSTVRLAIRRKDGMKVAIKSISKHDALKARRLRVSGRTYLEEWEILKQLNENEHVVSLMDMFESSEEIQLVLEYCQGGELFNAIQKKHNTTLRKSQYSEQDASIITQQLLCALKDIHARGIVHKDVKPENILLVSKENSRSIYVKLCDFGMARVICQDAGDDSSCDGDASPATPSRTQSFQLFSSDYYTAPELQLGGGIYDTAVDMFSLGVTVYILLCGFPPVFAGDDSDVVTFPSSYWGNISEDAKDFVRSLLAFEPEYRISAQRALQHAWIVNRNQVSGMSSTNLLTSETMRMALLKRRLYQCLKQPRSQLSKRSDDKEKYRGNRKRPRRASVTLIALADLCRGATASSSVKAIAAASLKGASGKKRKPKGITGPSVTTFSF